MKAKALTTSNLGSLESGVYQGKNEDGQTIIVTKYQQGWKISTYQDNGWIQVAGYDQEGNCEEVTYEK